MPAQNRSEMGPPKSRIQRPPSDPTPASYHRTATRDSIDSSRASTLSTNDEDEKSSIDEIGPEHDDDDENDNKNETKESEERNQLRNSHSHVLSTSNDTTVDQRKFQSAMVPELQLDNNKKKIDCRGKRDEDTSLMTPPSSVARPLHIFQGFDLTDMKKFLMSPIPKDAGVVQCYIKRNRIGMNKLYPIYSIYLKTGDRFLMSSRKRPNNKTSNYLISMSEYDLNRVGDNYLGKLRSNFVGTEFQIFDDGVNPKDSEDTLGSTNGGYIGSGQTQQFVNKETRQELGVVIYAPNVLGSRGPRKMQVAIPEVDEFNLRKPTRNSRASTTSITTDSQTTTRRSRTSSLASSLARRFSFSTTTDTGTGAVPTDDGSPQVYDDLLSMVKDRCYHDLNYYINKPPRWNEQVSIIDLVLPCIFLLHSSLLITISHLHTHTGGSVRTEFRWPCDNGISQELSAMRSGRTG